MTGLQLTDFEIAVLIGVVLVIVAVLVLAVRRIQPAPNRSGTASSANPADLVGIEDRIKAVENRVFEVEHGVNQLRTAMGALPTKDSVHGIALKVAELQGDLKVNNMQTHATAKGVERIENWLMEEAQQKAEAAKKAEREKGDTK